MRKVQKEISDAKAEYTEIAEEVFSNVRTVKAFANEDTETIKFCDKNLYLYERSKYAANIYGFW